MPYRLFIDYGFTDVRYTQRIGDLVRALGHSQVAMPLLAAISPDPQDTMQRYADTLPQADLFIGIYAPLHWPPLTPEDLSLHEFLYETAKIQQVPCLIYLSTEENEQIPPELPIGYDGARQRLFWDSLQSEHPRPFSSIDELLIYLKADLEGYAKPLPRTPEKAFNRRHFLIGFAIVLATVLGLLYRLFLEGALP